MSGKRRPEQSGDQIAMAATTRERAKLAPSALLVADVRSSLGVSRELFARLTGFSVRAFLGWEAGRPVSEAATRRVTEMKRLRDALAEGVRQEFIAQWLVTPCEGLGGLKPVEVLERGESDRLWRSCFADRLRDSNLTESNRSDITSDSPLSPPPLLPTCVCGRCSAIGDDRSGW